jgi:CRISPR/Cas system-associated exonuclease Cas4 (RecB family)
MEPPDYLPISMLNQLLYCERRFWYMYVLGELAVNAALLASTLAAGFLLHVTERGPGGVGTGFLWRVSPVGL